MDSSKVTCSPDSGDIQQNIVSCPPLSHAASISVEMRVRLPAALGTPHSQLESLRSSSGVALWVVAVCVRSPALLSVESQEKMPSHLPEERQLFLQLNKYLLMACHSPWHESGMEEHDRDKPLGYTFVARDAQPAGWVAASRKGWGKGASAYSLLYVLPHIPPGPYPMQG